MPTPNQGHLDVLLSNISVAYIQGQDKYVADKIFPIVPVEKASNKYLVYPKGAFFRDQVGPRPLGGESPSIDFQVSNDNYYCEEEGLSAWLDDRERANATPPYDPERGRVQLLTQQHLIHRDRMWANSFFKAGVWANEVQGMAVAPGAGQILQWDNANSTPLQDVDDYRDQVLQATGFEPNVMVLGRKVFRKLKQHPQIVDRIKYTQKGIITQDLLAQFFGVDKLVVPGGINNTAKEGAVDAMDFIFSGTEVLMAYSAPNPGLEQPTAGYTFAWTGLIPGGGLQAAVHRLREEKRHSDWFEVRMAYDMKSIATDLAVFFKNAVA